MKYGLLQAAKQAVCFLRMMDKGVRMTEKKPPHLYCKHFTCAERRLLKAIKENDLAGEINLLRVHNGRFFGLYVNSSAIDIKLQITTLQAMSNTANTIAKLVRTQSRVQSPGSLLEVAIEETLNSLRKELGI